MRDKIISQPGYWVEQINGILYDAIMDYMETHNMKRKDLAKHLGISKGRVSQIINDGEINFRLEKIIEISLKLGMVPHFSLEEKAEFLAKEEIHLIKKEINDTADFFESDRDDTKVVQLYASTKSNTIVESSGMNVEEPLAQTC